MTMLDDMDDDQLRDIWERTHHGVPAYLRATELQHLCHIHP
jgi:hypothetical protein